MTATHLRLAETTAERDEWRRLAARLAEALRGQVPTSRAPDCWCHYSRDVAGHGHESNCIKARAALAKYEAARGKTGGEKP